MRKSILFLLTAVLMAACAQEPKQEPFTEAKALDFLYQYMPLGDNVDYTKEYYQECVHYAFRDRKSVV